LGVLSIEAALAQAAEFGFDLVEVNPMAKPPVCKIMDYGKFKYEEKKRASEAKKKQVVVHLKEVKLRPKTEEHDYEFKVRNVKRFLEEGNKARVTIMFRGRDVKDIAVVEQPSRMEGRQMYMILAPNPKVAQRARDQARQHLAAMAASKKHAHEPPKAGSSSKPVPEPGTDQEPRAAAAVPSATE